jgi:hypothetical protein
VKAFGEKLPLSGVVGDVGPSVVMLFALAAVQIDVAVRPTVYWVESVA